LWWRQIAPGASFTPKHLFLFCSKADAPAASSAARGNRTSRWFGMTDAGEEFHRHAVLMLREAEQAETAIRHRLRANRDCALHGGCGHHAVRDARNRGGLSRQLPKVNVVAHE